MSIYWRISFSVSVLLVLGLLVSLPNAFGQQRLTAQQPPSHRTPAPERTPYGRAPGARSANETYIVVEIGVDIQVVPKSELASLKKRIEDEYKSDMRKYQEDKKNKNNREVNAPKPVKKTVKILKSAFKSQEDAQKFADEKIKEREKSGVKKTNW